jgi:hypothetical protein
MSVFWRPITAGEYPQFAPPYRQVRRGVVCVLWARCDLCRWSGPLTRFVTLKRGDDSCNICLHDWCYGNAFVRDQFVKEGWA